MAHEIEKTQVSTNTSNSSINCKNPQT